MKDRVPALDGVRGLALLMVLVHHSVTFIHGGATTRFEDLVGTIAGGGWLGVDLFFVLSGYLITGILLRTKGSARYFSNFIARRALRIFPLYYLFLIVFFLILPHLLPHNAELAKLPALRHWYWSYLPNLRIFLDGDWNAVYVEHTWSLAIEEQFYLAWPLVVALCSRRTLVRLCALGVAASLALRVYLVSHGAGRAAAFVLTPAHLDGLLLGAMLATLEPAIVAHPIRARRLLLSIGGFGLSSVVLGHLAPVSYNMRQLAFSVTSFSLMFVAFVGLTVLADPASPLSRILSARGLHLFGKYSYGLYIVHPPLFRLLAPHVGTLHLPIVARWCLLGLVGSGLSLALAVLLYEGYESRFLALKRYFEPGRAAADQAPAPDPAY